MKMASTFIVHYFFYDCHTFPIKIVLLSQTILTKLFLFYLQETMFKKPWII